MPEYDYKAHILVVDDDNRILELLKKFLCQNGFQVSTAIDSQQAGKLLETSTFDLIILDVMLPNVTGFDFARTIKASGCVVPIVMLTALSEVSNRIEGLEAGAADYLTKPFEPRELLLRIKNLINNSVIHKREQKIKRLGNNYYNLDSKEFIKQDQPIQLSSTEQKLLEILISRNGQTVTREELSEIMGGLSLRSIDVQIVRIRSKIEDDPKQPKYLQTIRNKGYALYS